MLQYRIALSLIPGVGDIIGKNLVSYCGGVEAVFKEKKSNLLKIPNIGETLVNSIVNHDLFDRVDKEIAFIEKFNIKPLFYLDAAYPARLKQCIDSPMMLYYIGNADLNASKIVSVVGTRNITEYGKDMCKQLVKDLAAQEITIVSGLAYGVDTCAHKTANENNMPTVAVLAHGLDRVYPHLNKALAEKMIKNGGLLTEFMSETIPDRENFPKRNRIIAGMADAVIVVEAAKKGGALITADIANSYNRDVFAVPGKLTDTFSEGCNHLIKINKAALLESANDLLYIMGWELNKKPKKTAQRQLFIELKPEEQIIYDLLNQKASSSIDELCINARLNVSKVAEALLNLELEGIIKAMPGKVYKLA
ncbi:MAG: DNA-processing protein DprA [Bacteroidetes bacterium]|nr:DNA-processing protein DprA [Bacteroidota bacterium]